MRRLVRQWVGRPARMPEELYESEQRCFLTCCGSGVFQPTACKQFRHRLRPVLPVVNAVLRSTKPPSTSNMLRANSFVTFERRLIVFEKVSKKSQYWYV